MKKRIALAVAFATAISIGNMVPAFATKLTAPSSIADNTCNRAGGTLAIEGSSDILIRANTSGLVVTESGMACTSPQTDFLNLTSVVVKGGAGVMFDLTAGASGSGTTLGNFRSVAFTVQATGQLGFNAENIDAVRYVSGTITEEAFTFGSLTGSYYAASLYFGGHRGVDNVDGSAVVTTPITMDGTAGTPGGADDLGDDVFKGGALGDTLTGGDGKDKLYGNGGADVLHADDDTSYALYSTTGAAAYADQAWGGAGDDSIYADQSDTVAPGDGYDVVTGDTRVHSLNYSDSTAAISIDLDALAGTVTSTAGNDTFALADFFVGSGFADSFTGDDAADDVFYGGEGADTILGLGGDDALHGGGGADVIKGGAGYDSIYGDTGADRINGGGDDDTVYGGGGDDIMYGALGNDVLKGNKGSDQAWGGKGHDDVCSAEVTNGCEFKK